jgi:hypothetical protein
MLTLQARHNADLVGTSPPGRSGRRSHAAHGAPEGRSCTSLGRLVWKGAWCNANDCFLPMPACDPNESAIFVRIVGTYKPRAAHYRKRSIFELRERWICLNLKS